MDWLRSYVKNLILCLIFYMFIEMILPSDKYKKYIDLVLGLILTLAIISPLSNLNKSGFIFNQKIFSSKRQDNKISLDDIYKKSIEKQINMLANKMHIKVADLNLEVKKQNNIYEIKNIRGKLDSDTQKENFIKALSLIYGLTDENIIFD